MTPAPPPVPPADPPPDSGRADGPDAAPDWVQALVLWLSALSLAAYLLASYGIRNHIRFLWAALAEVRRIAGL
jgi:hypothetical protein